jgi:hypothetical protein
LTKRFFVGYNQKGSMLDLYDPNGRLRLSASVDKKGNPKIEFLNAQGKVTYELPPAAFEAPHPCTVLW